MSAEGTTRLGPEGEQWRAPVPVRSPHYVSSSTSLGFESLAGSSWKILNQLSLCKPYFFNAATLVAACFARPRINSASTVMRAHQSKSGIGTAFYGRHEVGNAADSERLRTRYQQSRIA